jgi:acyl-CoA synthetase (AMP-forming)/AMP-acid ligase II
MIQESAAANRSQAMLLAHMLRQSATNHPDATAITIDGAGSTYRGLLAASLQRARMLQSVGVAKGDAIGLLLPNSPQFIEILLGASLMGAVVVPINTRFKAMEIAHIVHDADLKFIFTSDQFDEHVNFRNLLRETLPGLSGALDPSNLRLERFPSLRAAILIGNAADTDFLPDATLLQAAAALAPPSESDAPAAEDPQLILYTSGTTARPKGCIISGRALAASAAGVMKHFNIGPSDVWWCPLPMFHIGGILFTSVCLASGAHFVGMSHFQAEAALDQIAKHRPTILYPLFPTIAIPILRHSRFAGLELDSIRLVVSVATTPVQQDIQSRLPKAVLVSAFGMTETTGIVTFNRATDSLEERTSTVGSALPGWDIKIVDSETRASLRPGQRGEIAVRGPALFSGYLNEPALTARSFDPEGYFHTGDCGELSARGQLTFCGRLKDQLKVGGENVSALEVESYIGTHPQVALAQVVGIPDDHYGEVPVAFIELAGGGALDAQDVIDFCRGKIASFKIPKHVRFVTSWPMSATKIHKGKLRDTIIQELTANK